MTADEQLEHERQIAAILEIRRQPHTQESILRMCLNSSLLTAVIGVFGTAVLGVWVSGIIQTRSKLNELDSQARQARRESQNEAAIAILGRVGSFVNATDDLLVSVNNSFSESGRPPHEVTKLREWRVELSAKRDAADSEWRRDRASVGFKLQYLFGDEGDVVSSWKRVAGATAQFEACTRRWYVDNAAQGTSKGVEEICPAERAGTAQATESFAAAVRNQQKTQHER